MLRKVLSTTLTVVFTLSLCLFVYDQADARVTCSASASAGAGSASGSVSPGISDLELDHKAGQSYEGKGSVKLVVNNSDYPLIGKRIWVKVKVQRVTSTEKRILKKKFDVGADIIVPGPIISTTQVGSVVEVSYEVSVQITRDELYAIKEGASCSKSGKFWQYKDAIAFGNCGGASDSDGWKRYRPFQNNN